jgi:hypothetical protein
MASNIQIVQQSINNYKEYVQGTRNTEMFTDESFSSSVLRRVPLVRRDQDERPDQ